MIENMVFRLAEEKDFENIYNIWLKGINITFANFNRSNDIKNTFKINFDKRQGVFNYWVVEQVGEIVGWCSILPLTSNPLKYDKWAEVSTYIDNNFSRKGIGTHLMKYVFTKLQNSTLQLVFGFADSTNSKSISMCINAGMKNFGTIPVPNTPPYTILNKF